LSALEFGVDLACLDLRGSRDFLPFGSGRSCVRYLDLIYNSKDITEMDYLRDYLINTYSKNNSFTTNALGLKNFHNT
jgi:hypothetical protein